VCTQSPIGIGGAKQADKGHREMENGHLPDAPPGTDEASYRKTTLLTKKRLRGERGTVGVLDCDVREQLLN